jgi:hypothetical protein
MSELEVLFSEIEKLHAWEPCTDPGAFSNLEKRIGHSLPNDLRLFHETYNTVTLFPTGDYQATYRFVPVSQIHPTRQDVYGLDADEWGPSTWLTVCDVQDGNYVAIDVLSKDGDNCSYIDCFHEVFAVPGYSKIVARSFTELLRRALQGGDNHYWLLDGFVGYGDSRPLTPENASRRVGNPEAPRKGWIVEFRHSDIWHREFIADDDHGGPDGSFDAVKEYVKKHSK